MYEKLDMIKISEMKPLREIVFNSLKDAILKGKLEPKERLMEIKLANQLGVSRTPVREAIRMLELEGLVIMEPRKGAHVSDISLDDIIDTLEVREALETYAIKIASEKGTVTEVGNIEKLNEEFKKAFRENDIQKMVHCDTQIHSCMINMSHNKKLISFMNSLNEIMQRFRLIYFHATYDPENIINEHSSIIGALTKGDKEKAIMEMSKHLATLKDDIRKVYVNKNGRKTY